MDIEIVDGIYLFFYEHLHPLMLVKKLIEIDVVSKIVIDNHVRTSITSRSWGLIPLFPYRGGGDKPHRFWTSNRRCVFDMRRYICCTIMNSFIIEIYLLDFFYIRHSLSSSIVFVFFPMTSRSVWTRIIYLNDFEKIGSYTIRYSFIFRQRENFFFWKHLNHIALHRDRSDHWRISECRFEFIESR